VSIRGRRLNPRRTDRGRSQAPNVAQQHALSSLAVEGRSAVPRELPALSPAQAAAHRVHCLWHLQRPSGRRRLTELSDVVRTAVAVVCGADGASLGAGTTLAELHADSLVRVGIADVVEAELARDGVVVHIDDATLGRVTTLGEIDDYLAPQLVRSA
jgi:hypothetical protein